VSEPAVVKSVRYPADLVRAIERYASKNRRTFSFVVIDVMRSWQKYIEAKRKTEEK
jgi:hypothetical protein